MIRKSKNSNASQGNNPQPGPQSNSDSKQNLILRESAIQQLLPGLNENKIQQIKKNFAIIQNK